MPFRKKKKKDVDPTTQKLLKDGIVKIKSDKDDKKSKKEKLKEFGRVTYDFWSGVKYTLVLSALLWWLPLFGPMLAGYVGGRRTGGPKKGIIASILAIGVVGGFHYIFTHNLLPSNVISFIQMPSAAMAVAYQRPVLAPYARFLKLYWGAFFTQILGGLPYSPNSYIITVVFAYMGGIVSVEKKRELEEADGSSDTININLSKLVHSSSSNPKLSKKEKLIKSNYHNDPSKANKAKSAGQKRLQDLKAIQYNRGSSKSSKKKKNSKKKKSKNKSKKKKNKDNSSGWGLKSKISSKKTSRPPVRHHSNTEGDDWEFL